MFKERILGISAVVISILFIAESSFEYFRSWNLCMHSTCPIPLVDSMNAEKYVMALSVILVGLTAWLVVQNEKSHHRPRPQLEDKDSRIVDFE